MNKFMRPGSKVKTYAFMSLERDESLIHIWTHLLVAVCCIKNESMDRTHLEYRIDCHFFTKAEITCVKHRLHEGKTSSH